MFNSILVKVTIMKKGIFVFKGKVLESPYVMRQEADKIYINRQVVYPLPEREKGEPLFRTEPEIPAFQAPPKVEETLEDFQKSWASGLVRDKKGLIKKAAGLKRDEDVIRDASGSVRDADTFIQDYQAQKDALKKVLESERIPFVETEYNDILISVEKEWGIIALFNELDRVRMTEEIDKERLIPPKYPYTDAAKFKNYIETALKEDDMVVIDEGYLEFIPHELVDAAAEKIEDFAALRQGKKVKFPINRLPPVIEKPPKLLKSAVIFLPHFSWQKSFFGTNSRYPFSLAAALKSQGYRVRILMDTAVTLENWSQFLQSGIERGLKVIYNFGHGDPNIIAVGVPKLWRRWYYFNDQFVYKYTRLRKTIVYIYACSTLADDRLAAAFLNKGACTYGGWKKEVTGLPQYCDKFDSAFWRPLINAKSTVGTACRALNSINPNFECRGNNRCQLP